MRGIITPDSFFLRFFHLFLRFSDIFLVVVAEKADKYSDGRTGSLTACEKIDEAVLEEKFKNAKESVMLARNITDPTLKLVLIAEGLILVLLFALYW